MNELWVPDKKLHLPSPTKLELAIIPILGSFVEIGAWDKDGILYYRHREPSRSPIKALIAILLAGMSRVDLASITDAEGNSSTVDADKHQFKCDAALNDDGFGIIIGSNNTAVDIADYAINTRIDDGTSAGQMIYNIMNFDASLTMSASDATFDMWRNYNNNSGGSITVKETALHTKGFRTPATIQTWGVIRDVPSEVVVPDGGGCYVKYTLKITE